MYTNLARNIRYISTFLLPFMGPWWEPPYNLHDLYPWYMMTCFLRWISTFIRSCTVSHNGSLGHILDIDDLDHDLSADELSGLSDVRTTGNHSGGTRRSFPECHPKIRKPWT